MVLEKDPWQAVREVANSYLGRFRDAWTIGEREDLAQESALLAWQWGRSGRSLHQIEAAARTIAHRLRCRGLRNRHGRAVPRVASQERMEEFAAPSPPRMCRTWYVAGRRVTGDSMQRLLARALRQLRPIDRQLLLAQLEGFCHAEIACRVGRSKGNVKARLHRARRRVQREIESAVREAGDLETCPEMQRRRMR